MALKWVKKNIRDLGGDPERITLMGQSSGAVAAHFQVLAPKAKGLFDKAILQSGSALSPWALRNDHWKVAHTIGQIYNCSGITMDPPALDSTSLLYCLQGLDVKDLVVLPSYFTASFYMPSLFNSIMHANLCHVFQNAPLVMVPRVDGIYIPDHPAELLRSGRFNKVDLISGFNKDEGALEAMRK
ncbi:postsynaptic membrane assembly [Halocaridina rubra]|uniref:Postsynaptic membrane assembly n=1 Tax=Halocaridina rubra TaxID=373956 RepID=A0AAN8ZXJ1_HALRR